MTLAAGVRLGPYELIAPLGAGGMGEVYRARDARLGRDVALKVLPTEFTADPERLRRFEGEARAASAVSDPHIVTVFDVGTSGGITFLATELVEGTDLRALIGERLSRRKSIDLAAQIAEGLAAAHEKGIVHRDLKPENILVTRSGLAKVADFGLARLSEHAGGGESQMITAEVERTATGTVMGTVAYMSPEQARGERVDFRSDQFSLGIILHELVTGANPFKSATAPETLTAILREEPAIDAAAAPAQLRRIVARCLEKEPDSRYGSTRDLARDLRDVDVSSGAAPAAAVRKKTPVWPAVVAAGVAGLVLGAVVANRLRREAPVEPVRIHALTYSGADSEPAASPDGKLIAFTSWRDGTSRIWIKQLVGGGEAPLTSGPDGRARFSPDGSGLLFIRDQGTRQVLYRIGLVGGEPRRLLDDVASADWSPDGRKIVFLRGGAGDTDQHSRIGVLDLDGGRETMVADEGNRVVHSPRWSPDGRRIAYGVGGFSNGDWQVREVDLRTSKARDMCPLARGFQIGGLSWSGTGDAIFFVQSPNLVGDVTGSGSRVIRCGGSDERRTLFWSDGLVSTTSSISDVTLTDVLSPGRLIFSTRLRRQNLREAPIGVSGGAPVSRSLGEGSAIDRQPVYSPDGKTILFSSNRGGNLDLWAIDRTTGVTRQITDDPAQDWDPGYTPDGKQILWSRDRGDGSMEIWIANADGSGARQVTHDGVSAQNPTETRDGRWIVYTSGNPAKVGTWKIHPDGSGAALVKGGNQTQPEVSPDGRYVLDVDTDRLNLRATIRFVEVETGRAVPFEIENRFTLAGPAIVWGRGRWSPDGRIIYFVGQNDRGLSGIYAQEFAPGRDTRATRRPVAGFSRDYLTESLGVSPDGATLVISTGQDTSAIMVADGVPGALPPVRKGGS